MRPILFVALAFLAVTAVVHVSHRAELVGSAEAATPRAHTNEHISPEKFYNLIVAPSGTCSVDFGALVPLNQGTGNPCLESATCAAVGQNGAPGAVIGDGCVASTSMGSDAGSFLSSTAQLSCRAVTDGVVFKVCFQATDGGSLDLGAAWFTGTVIKH